MTKAQKQALIRIVRISGPRCIMKGEAINRHLGAEFRLLRRVGLIQSAGYECSVKADEWLQTAEGRALLDQEDKA
jgi:hypothetical protein